MPDTALSDAIKEAYASAPADLVIYHTLELYHATFTVPIRVVRDSVALQARLEQTAPREAGQSVSFAAYAFDIRPPNQITTGLPTCTIEIDNVSRDIGAQLDLAVSAGTPIEVLYRQFLSDTVDDGPETDPPITLTLQTVTITPFRISAQAGFPDLLNLAFPGYTYTFDQFPGLVG